LFDDFARISETAGTAPEAVDISEGDLARDVIAAERERLYSQPPASSAPDGEAVWATHVDETTLHALASARFPIEPDRAHVPDGDCVVICGPKSAPMARTLLAADSLLGFERDDEGWSVTDGCTGRRHSSPFGRDQSKRSDIGYFPDHDSVVVHIAGATSVGSLGVAHWLDAHLSELYEPATTFVSGVVECDFDDEFTVTGTKLLAGPYRIE
jgi:hypothetical protein